MFKKILLILVFSLIASGIVFADDDDTGKEEGKTKSPKHTITIDATSTAASLFASLLLGDTLGLNSFIIISALQYEYQLTYRTSLSGRFGIKYLSFADLFYATAMSFEGHFRFYPSARAFFLDAEAGYALFMVSEQNNSHLATIGGKLGWRIDFGKPGGFVLEPALGYLFPIGKIRSDYSDIGTDFFIKHYFIGGFQIGLNMGARF